MITFFMCIKCLQLLPINLEPPVTTLAFQEIKREKAKAAAAIRTLQEKMEEKLRMELEQKVDILPYMPYAST